MLRYCLRLRFSRSSPPPDDDGPNRTELVSGTRRQGSIAVMSFYLDIQGFALVKTEEREFYCLIKECVSRYFLFSLTRSFLLSSQVS